MKYKSETIYCVPVSKRGQVTIPKKLRDMLGVTNQHLWILVAKDKKGIRLKPCPDIITLAGKFPEPANKKHYKGK